MRLVIQRVRQAQVDIEGQTVGKIGQGMMILVGVEESDGADDISWLCNKVVNLRIFNDADGVMNIPITQLPGGGEILVVSQFTLMASTKKGNRPSYIRAAKPDISVPIYEQFLSALTAALGKPLQTGRFGADMQVSLTNDGPVTIIIDSKLRE